MRVLVSGAYGLIGSAVLARLNRDGHELVGAGRSIASARRRFPYAQWVVADFHALVTPAQWMPLLAGIDAVVNCVGAFQNSLRDDLQRIHVAAPLALVRRLRAGRGEAHRPHLGDRRRRRGAERVRHHQGRGR